MKISCLKIGFAFDRTSPRLDLTESLYIKSLTDTFMKFHHKAHLSILMLRVQPSNICTMTVINIINLCETKYAGMIDTKIQNLPGSSEYTSYDYTRLLCTLESSDGPISRNQRLILY